MKKPTHILVKRWFQKTYGNTYFSATVSFDENGSTWEEKLINFQYGYGSHGEHESIRRLKEQGFDVNGIDVTVVDVKRKKEL